MTKVYFHTLTEDEWEGLKNSEASWWDIMSSYSAPDWCEDGQGALAGAAGCSSLTLGFVKKEDDCKDCPLYKSI